MSEKLQSSPEHGVEQIDTSAESQKSLERLTEAAEQAEKDPIAGHIESIKRSVETQAISGKEHNVGDKNTEGASQEFGQTQQLKKDGYKRSLKMIQSNLNLPDRTLSRIVHQPAVERVSNGLAKTVARPSAFLGGSMGALIGSAGLLYISKHNGFTYNYAVFLLLFVGGFFAGALVETLWKLTIGRKSR